MSQVDHNPGASSAQLHIQAMTGGVGGETPMSL
jgi:hypothetical protein